jgi:hypothetical protein
VDILLPLVKVGQRLFSYYPAFRRRCIVFAAIEATDEFIETDSYDTWLSKGWSWRPAKVFQVQTLRPGSDGWLYR